MININKAVYLLFHGAAICICSCAASRNTTSSTVSSSAVTSPVPHAQELKQYCVTHGIKRKEILKADSLTAASVRLTNSGKEAEAKLLAETAASYYNLAIARYELSQALDQIRELKQELAEARAQLKTYKELLNELEK